MKAIALAVLTLSFGMSAPSTSFATSASPNPHATFRVLVPTGLPAGFHRVTDPLKTTNSQDAATHIMRRYGANSKWVEMYEGSAGCCLDIVSDHLVGLTKLAAGRTGYFSDQGQQFGGFYLFWDQGHTYICLNSPNLSKSVLVRVAEAMSTTQYIHP
jgi:hypothetical protein